MANPLGGISQLGGMYDDDMIRQATELAGMIRSYRAEAKARQKSEALKPFVTALQDAANQYNTAADDTARANASALASLTRENMLRGGFSPSDIDQRYWGSDPSRGFQTTKGFEAPVTGYEGLGRKEALEAIRRAMSDQLVQRETEAGLTGIDPLTGQKTWNRQYQEATLARSSGGGGGGGGGGSAPKAKSLYDQAKAAAYNDPRLWMGDDDPPEGSWSLNDLINAYMKTLGGGGGDDTASLIQQARANGWSDDEIRQALRSEGKDPAKYGL